MGCTRGVHALTKDVGRWLPWVHPAFLNFTSAFPSSLHVLRLWYHFSFLNGCSPTNLGFLHPHTLFSDFGWGFLFLQVFSDFSCVFACSLLVLRTLRLRFPVVDARCSTLVVLFFSYRSFSDFRCIFSSWILSFSTSLMVILRFWWRLYIVNGRSPTLVTFFNRNVCFYSPSMVVLRLSFHFSTN